jgi:hypothetical protein
MKLESEILNVKLGNKFSTKMKDRVAMVDAVFRKVGRRIYQLVYVIWFFLLLQS